MPLFILAGGELVLLFLGARIAWWILRTREPGAAARGGAPAGGGIALRAPRAARAARASAPQPRSEILREAA